MKWSSFRSSVAYKDDLRVLREDELKNFYPHVIQIANTFSRDAVASGILDIADFIQAGNAGLVEAYSKVDWDLINESPNPDGQLWSFLKKRIKFAIRREIDNCGAFIKIPRRQLEDHRKNLTAHDKILVSMFPQFFDRGYVEYAVDISSWRQEQLGLVLDDIIYSNIQSFDHQAILKMSFGMDTMDDKPVSIKELAKKFRLSEIGIKKIKQRSLDKIKDNPDNITIIEKFLQN